VHWLDFNKGILILEMHGTNIKIISENIVMFGHDAGYHFQYFVTVYLVSDK
jgi:hypothetical protein